MKRLPKALHRLAGLGLLLSVALQGLLVWRLTGVTPSEIMNRQQFVTQIQHWGTTPFLVLVLASGLFAIGSHPRYAEAPWLWIKLGFAMVVFAVGFVGVPNAQSRVLALAASPLTGPAGYAPLGDALSAERAMLWLLLTLILAAAALGLWRPRFGRAR